MQENSKSPRIAIRGLQLPFSFAVEEIDPCPPLSITIRPSQNCLAIPQSSGQALSFTIHNINVNPRFSGFRNKFASPLIPSVIFNSFVRRQAVSLFSLILQSYLGSFHSYLRPHSVPEQIALPRQSLKRLHAFQLLN